MHRGITAEIDLEAAAHNLRQVKKAAKNLPVIAVVKADAYGHGAYELSYAFQKAGASALAVAFTSEARQLREAGINIPILVLFDQSDIPSYFDLNLIPAIHDLKTAKALSREAGKRNVTLDVHLKVETGMGRLGLNNEKDVLKILELPNLRISGLMSHFSEAELADMDYVKLQLKRFKEIKSCLREKGLRPSCHIANSAAVLSFRDSHLNAVRPGLILYGCLPFEENRAKISLKPVMKVKTKILALRRLPKGQPVSYGRTFITRRQTLAAILPVGYADGYLRAMSNNSYVLIRGKRAPVIGRVCMDLIVVDVTDIKTVKEQDDVVLLGSDGKETITAWELARNASTIPYEIMLSLGTKSRRVYSGEKSSLHKYA